MKSRKAIKKCIFALLILSLFALMLFYLKLIFKAPIQIQTKEYDVDLYIDGAALTKYKGGGKDVVIPEQIWGRPVFAIGERCFSNNVEIENVRISNNVKYIKDSAFSGCDNLKSVEGCSIIQIEKYAFSCDSKLEKVELGDKLRVIGDMAFVECTSLKYIPAQDYLYKIGEKAFSDSGVSDPGEIPGVDVASDAFADDWRRD